MRGTIRERPELSRADWSRVRMQAAITGRKVSLALYSRAAPRSIAGLLHSGLVAPGCGILLFFTLAFRHLLAPTGEPGGD